MKLKMYVYSRCPRNALNSWIESEHTTQQSPKDSIRSFNSCLLIKRADLKESEQNEGSQNFGWYTKSKFTELDHIQSDCIILAAYFRSCGRWTGDGPEMDLSSCLAYISMQPPKTHILSVTIVCHISDKLEQFPQANQHTNSPSLWR